MPRAFILINVEPGTEEKALNHLKSIEGVEESYVTYGVYDLLLRVNANSMEELKDFISHKIRMSKDIRSTLTLIMMEE
jgi:DNA-binding Lrp family transcriptional regulator